MKQFIPLAASLAGKWSRRLGGRIDIDECMSAAQLGLLNAAHGYKPDSGSFMNYAYTRIQGEIKDTLRRMFGRYNQSVLARSSSLDDIPNDIANDRSGRFVDERANVEAAAEKSEAVGELRNALRVLTPRQREVIELADIHGMRLVDVATKLGLSQSRVSQIRRVSLDKMRKELELDAGK